jgi:hypothetical protein
MSTPSSTHPAAAVAAAHDPALTTVSDPSRANPVSSNS